MPADFPKSLRTDIDPPVVEVLNRQATSGIVIVCDHAGHALPQCFAGTSLSAADRVRHIAWDIGGRDIALRLAERLDAVLVSGVYSRLVIDLNRYPWDPAAIAETSDGTPIDFNADVDSPERQLRIDEFHRPYHDAIGRELDAIEHSGRSPTLISVHTMTDRLAGGAPRPESFAVLWQERDPLLSRPMLDWLRAHAGAVVGDNQPYALDLGIDFTIPEHGFRRAIPTFMFEVRQDLVAAPATARAKADLIADGLRTILR